MYDVVAAVLLGTILLLRKHREIRVLKPDSRRQLRMITRREVLAAGIAGAAVTASATAAAPLLGLVSPVDLTVPPEAAAMYPSGVRFQQESVGLKTMTPEGYDQVLDRIVPFAKSLAGQGAQAIVLMGTSLSFYKGAPSIAN